MIHICVLFCLFFFFNSSTTMSVFGFFFLPVFFFISGSCQLRTSNSNRPCSCKLQANSKNCKQCRDREYREWTTGGQKRRKWPKYKFVLSSDNQNVFGIIYNGTCRLFGAWSTALRGVKYMGQETSTEANVEASVETKYDQCLVYLSYK